MLHAWNFSPGRLPAEVNVEELREALAARQEKREQKEKEQSCRSAEKESEKEPFAMRNRVGLSVHTGKCVEHIWIKD